MNVNVTLASKTSTKTVLVLVLKSTLNQPFVRILTNVQTGFVKCRSLGKTSIFLVQNVNSVHFVLFQNPLYCKWNKLWMHRRYLYQQYRRFWLSLFRRRTCDSFQFAPDFFKFIQILFAIPTLLPESYQPLRKWRRYMSRIHCLQFLQFDGILLWVWTRFEDSLNWRRRDKQLRGY